MLARVICDHDDLLERHVQYWLAHAPDLTDMPSIKHTDLQFWAKQKRKDRTKGHRFLQGLKASWVNVALDFVISKNKWPVVFEARDGQTVDLLDEFIAVMWVAYVRQMKARPSLKCNASQLVRKYLMLHKGLVSVYLCL